ncbi:hypothetical protein A2U01_0057967, partial [Trifolium medium]|nr:hypothetical protein [Trifolium medium]
MNLFQLEQFSTIDMFARLTSALVVQRLQKPSITVCSYVMNQLVFGTCVVFMLSLLLFKVLIAFPGVRKWKNNM